MQWLTDVLLEMESQLASVGNLIDQMKMVVRGLQDAADSLCASLSFCLLRVTVRYPATSLHPVLLYHA